MAASRRKPLLGSETPRIYTKPLRELTPETSLGFAAVEFAEDVCGVTLYPWQRWLLIHALELHPEGGFRFRTVVVLVARQNGKSMLSVILSLFFMYVLGREMVIGTAQDLDVAEEIWQEAVDLVEEVPDLDALKHRVIKVNGKKTLELNSGERYKVKAANRRAGRGLSGELILLDELREHQTWDAWGAITKTTMARPDAQAWAYSNAGDATSVVLRYLRKKAHAALGDPDGINAEESPEETAEAAELDEDEAQDESTLGLFEWSAAPGRNTKDRDGWGEANPALGHGYITERTLASAQDTDPEWIFRTECMCQWSDGTLEGPFPPGSWEACADDDSRRSKDAPVKLCVEVSWDRSKAHIGLAAKRDDGTPHLELIATRAGTDWVAPLLTSDTLPEFMRDAPVAIQKGSPASSLIEPLREADVEVVEVSGADMPTATGVLYDAVRQAADGAPGIRHRNQPALNLAASVAVPKLTASGAFMWDRKKSPADIGPLCAITGALWLLTRPEDKPTTSAYEDHDLIVI